MTERHNIIFLPAQSIIAMQCNAMQCNAMSGLDIYLQTLSQCLMSPTNEIKTVKFSGQQKNRWLWGG